MSNTSYTDRRLALLTSWAIPVFAVYLGFRLIPPEKYNEVMGDLIPIGVFGFGGAVAAAVSFWATLGVLGSARLNLLPFSSRVLVALLIATCACAGAVYCGLKLMLGLTPAIY